MQHWHTGDGFDLPRVLDKILLDKFNQTNIHNITFRDGNASIKITPGAGSYEDKFRHYWWIVAWCLLVFQILNMLVVVSFVAGITKHYAWEAHLLGSVLVFITTGFAAMVYRFVLFPMPSYHSYGDSKVVINQLPKATNGVANGVDHGSTAAFDPVAQPQPAPATMRN